MNLRLIAFIAVLISLAGLASWVQQDSEETIVSTQAEKKKQRHTPDYFMEGLEITSMNEKGEPRSLLVSDKLIHYADDGSTELNTPVMTLYNDIGKPWVVKAHRGWVSADHDLILLSGKVTIDRASGPNNRPVQLFTERLRIHPDSDFAETDQPVTMVSNKRRTSATGMRAYVRDGQLQLLNKVRVSYEK